MCGKELDRGTCTHRDVRTVQLRGADGLFSGQIVLMCEGCRKANRGEYRLMGLALNKSGYTGQGRSFTPRDFISIQGG